MKPRTIVTVVIPMLVGGSAMAGWMVLLAARHGAESGSLVMTGAAGFGLGVVGGAMIALFWWAGRTALGPKPERLPLQVGELILLERMANHMQGLEGRSGALALTTRRLLFHPRSLNFRREALAVDLASIRDARAIGFESLAVDLDAGRVVFVVSDTADLALLIRELVAALETDRATVATAWREAPPEPQ